MTISKPDCRWIYEQYRDKIFGYVSSRIHNRAEAEDVVSTIFLKICKNIDKYNPEKASLSTWVYTITRNTVYDSLKALRDRPAFELLENTPSPENVEEKVLSEELLEELACALEKLPQRERDAVILLYYRKLDRKTVADALGITYAQLRYLHDKAIQKLEKLLS